MTDFEGYATRIAEKFDYRNTFYDREPRFDITNPGTDETGKYDFLISSEVFEHVAPPPEFAFRNACRLLKPNGVLIFSVPYSIDPSMKEHFPELHHWGLARIGGETVLVNRTRTGELQVFENLVFHGCGAGKALEMREFNERELKQMLIVGGFCDLQFYAEDDPSCGIVYTESWSLPLAARKGEFALNIDTTRELMVQWREAQQRLDEETKGRKRGFL